MDKKTMTIVGVVVVVIIVIAAAAIVLSQNNNNQKEYNAQELANNFIKNYDGTFGEFKVANTDSNNAELSATVNCILKDGSIQKNAVGSNKTRTSMFKIITFESKDKAAEEYDKYISVLDTPYESKNGTKGQTILSQVNPVGMASSYCTVLNGTKNIKVTAEGATVKTVKASDFEADQVYILYGAYYSDKNAQFTLTVGVLQLGKNLVIFNQTSNTGYGIYYNAPVKADSEAAAGEPHITQDNFETALKNFSKAF
jgi:hypothetical protein